VLTPDAERAEAHEAQPQPEPAYSEAA
jgi:hypothetical protein